MRTWINASSFLTEAGIINTKQEFKFTWPKNDGTTGTWSIDNAKESVGMIWDEVPQITTWLQTVFFNYIKLHARDRNWQIVQHFVCMTVDDFIRDVVADMAFGREFDSERPLAELFGDGDLNDSRFEEYIKRQLPDWAQDGDVLFPWDATAFYSATTEYECGINMEEILHYLQARVDNGDNIKRLSVPDAIRLSNVWHNQKKKFKGQELEGIDTKDIMAFQDGYKIVQLLTPNALDRESAECDHCVGLGGYDKDIVTGRVKIFSLRDQSNKPLATIEVRNKGIDQVKGPKNGPVAEEIRIHVYKFVIAAGLKMDHDLDKIGLERIQF